MPKKKQKGASKRKLDDKDTFESDYPEDPDSIIAEPCIPDQYEDNISSYERENMDLLDTLDGLEYERDQFDQDFPHIAREVGNASLNYPMDAVRWNDEECAAPESSLSEEADVLSLLRRSRSEKEALEIIRYLEKRGEISPFEADKLQTQLKKKGLKAFK
ncbi:MAG: DUF2095 domain-containing protein [Promethearchaeota archaeon]|nr:MAG: DUF2095 domain-containing protein [Candidatus Lokiarchaeota archaeon]